MTTLARFLSGTDADAAPDGAATPGPVVAVVHRVMIAMPVVRGMRRARPDRIGRSRAARRDLALRVLIAVYAGWVAFAAALTEGRLVDVAAALAALPEPLATSVHLAALPWMLGAAIWAGPWPAAIRLIAVGAFAASWCSAARTLATAYVLGASADRS